MRRRKFGTLIGGLPAAVITGSSPHVLHAQSRPTLRLGMTSFGNRNDRLNGYAALFERLAELGYIEGRNLEVEFSGDLNPEQLLEGFVRAVRRGANILFRLIRESSG